ncbi:MAG: PEP-CTERM sorting domain-containing protein [Candidatus Bathyarchaeia archaeon]
MDTYGTDPQDPDIDNDGLLDGSDPDPLNPAWPTPEPSIIIFLVLGALAIFYVKRGSHPGTPRV